MSNIYFIAFNVFAILCVSFLLCSVCVYGGGNRREQVKVVTDGVDIIIATPGRLNDLVVGGKKNFFSMQILRFLIK